MKSINNYALKIDYLMECILQSHKLWNRLIVTAFTIRLSLHTAKLLNWMSDNLKIPIIWHLGIVPKTGNFGVYTKTPSLKTGKCSKNCLCTSPVMVSPDLLSYTLSISSAMKTPENTDDPEPYEGDTQMQYSLSTGTVST
jgi:hypothetical protein